MPASFFFAPCHPRCHRGYRRTIVLPHMVLRRDCLDLTHHPEWGVEDRLRLENIKRS
jgi:hypothetical protein